MSFVEQCRELIGLDSTPGQGSVAVMEWLKVHAEKLGFKAEIFHENQDGLQQANLLLRPSIHGHTKEEVLFQTHLDTVEPGNYGSWTKTQANPFQVSVYGDEMFGLGVADVKLDFLCKIEAAKHFLDRPLTRPFVLAATYGAQTGMNGAIRLVRKKLIHAKHAFVGEPTGLQVCAAGMGLVTVDIFIPFEAQEKEYRDSHDLMESSSTQSKVFYGKAAHSSNPQSGENAISKALDYLGQLPSSLAIMDFDGGINDNSVPPQAFLEIDFVGDLQSPTAERLIQIYKCLKNLEVKMFEEKDNRFSPGHPTLNLGTIRTNSAGIHLSGSCRIPPSVEDSVYRSWMNDIGEVCEKAGSSFSVRDYRRGFDSSTSEFASIVSSINEELGHSKELSATSTTSEASVFAKLGISCVVYGAGNGLGNSHEPNESVKISDLNHSIQFYKTCMERFCR